MPAMVVVPSSGARRVLRVDKVERILANRMKGNEEQFLVQWRINAKDPLSRPPLSWHNLKELRRCLELVQEYLESRAKGKHIPKKRKRADNTTEYERRRSPFDRLGNGKQDSSRASSVASSELSMNDETNASLAIDIYNGILELEDGLLVAKYVDSDHINKINISTVPTPEMQHMSQKSKVSQAEILIRAEYLERLKKVPGKTIHFTNIYDTATPSLRFRYIADYVLQEGVYRVDPAAQVGCTKCSPHMGRGIGCEYTKKCDCLEYATVDEARLDDDQRWEFMKIQAAGGSTRGLPKKFPYFCEGTKTQRAGCLVPFYLNSRNPIYECNDRCNCGPSCRNKNVQFGRQVELEIFRTGSGRGWGLRSRDPVSRGQFIDTYRGEVITDAEASRREAASSKAKASYLYSLDKFAESEGLADEHVYVVDGEFMGGPTIFMNHSCEPNCRQYTVSYNKHDCYVYDIAFFAIRDIDAGEELTFDYLDKDEDDVEPEEPTDGAIPCLCGAEKCRKWLWT